MKRVAIILINLIFIVFILKSICFAKSDLKLEADKYRINKDENVNITLKIEDVSIAALTLEIYFDKEKLELVSSPENSNYSNNRLLYTWIDETGQGQENLEISGFVFKSISDENTSTSIISTGEFYNREGEKIEVESYSLELQMGEEEQIVLQRDIELNNNTEKNNTNLQILRLNHVGISPVFSKDIKEYYIILDNRINELEVTAIPENQNAKVSISGNSSLKNGLNIVNIKVESEDKSKVENYKIYVTKTANQESANANLETLAIRDVALSPEFDNNITKYNVELANNMESIYILAIPEKENANIQIKKPEKLEIGDNQIEIIVMAEDGVTKKKYEIIAHRRNSVEQTEYEEERKEQEDALNSILEEKEENSINIINGENRKEKDGNNIRIWGPFISLVVIVFFICLIRKKSRKQ